MASPPSITGTSERIESNELDLGGNAQQDASGYGVKNLIVSQSPQSVSILDASISVATYNKMHPGNEGITLRYRSRLRACRIERRPSRWCITTNCIPEQVVLPYSIPGTPERTDSRGLGLGGKK